MGILFSIAFLLPTTASAIEVDTDVDNLATDGNCSLREALENANVDTDVYSDCGITDPDLISFLIPLRSSKVIFLDPSLGQLNIDDHLSIEGLNRGFFRSRVTVDGQNASRVFDIASNKAVAIEDLVVRRADAGTTTGGGINMNTGAALALDNVDFTENAAGFGGGVYSRGELTIANCLFSDNHVLLHGGGLDVFLGSAEVTNTDFRDNSAEEGGGIHVHADTEFFMDWSTVDNNQATLGGGINFQASSSPTEHDIWRSTISRNIAEEGGGLHIGHGNVTLSGSTVSNNDAEVNGGGAYIDTNGTLLSFNNTITQNHAHRGGGIWLVTPYTVALKSTIVALNSSDVFGATDRDLGGGGVSSLGYNFVSSLGTLAALPTDQFGSWFAPIDPMLEVLQKWDPSDPTETHMPMKDVSPVLDQGTSSGALGTDQRASRRLVDLPIGNAADGTDVGSVEFPLASPI